MLIADLNAQYPSEKFLNCFLKKSTSSKLPLDGLPCQASPLEYSRRKLIGYKYPLDSEFGIQSSKFATFSRAKKEFSYPKNENPAPNAYEIEKGYRLIQKKQPGVVFSKKKKTFYRDELPRTETPGPIYTYKKSMLSNS